MPDPTRSSEPLNANLTLFVDADTLARQRMVLRHLVVGLVDQALPLRIVSTDAAAEELALGPVQVLRREKVHWPFAGRKLAALIEHLAPSPPTILHALSATSYRLTRDLAEEFDADLVWSATSVQDIDALAEFDLRRVDRVTTHSHAMAAHLRGRTGLGAEKLHVLPPGVLAATNPSAFTHPDRQPTIISSSPLELNASIRPLILAVEDLRRRERNVSLFLLGEGSQERSLRRLVRDRKLSAQVTFARLSGDLTSVLQHADIFARPANMTAFEDHTLQAMAAGLVVLSGSSEIDDHLRLGETMVRSDLFSAEAIAQTIEQVLADVGATRAIAVRALDYVRSHHTISGMAQRTGDLYRGLAVRRATFSVGR